MVDDDGSENNSDRGNRQLSRSDETFRRLVVRAAGGDASAWAVDIVSVNQSGPTLERLQEFNLVIWYTGGSYGGNPDNTAVLSLADEKTVQRYIEQTGGTFVLLSPGYLSNHAYATSWQSSPHPFLREVMGIDGFLALTKRFAAGTVRAFDSSRYVVDALNAPPAEFSAVNPDGSAIVFTSQVDPAAKTESQLPVAVANAYRGGRCVYVGFTVENVPQAEQAKAFDVILAAAGVSANKPGNNAVTDGPHRFAVSGDSVSPFNFSASQTGPIRVQVQSQGVPITLTVLHPDGRKVEHQGSGNFSFDDNVAAADIAQGHMWGITVRATLRTSAVTPIGTGTSTVTHPPSDPVAVQAQLDQSSLRTTVLRRAPVVLTEKPSLAALQQIASTSVATTGLQTVTVRPLDPTQTIKPGVSVAMPAQPGPLQATVSVLPGVVTTAQFAGPEPILRFDVMRGSSGAPLKVWGKDLFPPKTGARRVLDQPAAFAAEMHFVWGDREWVMPMTAWENFRGYENQRDTETEDDRSGFQEYINGRWYVGEMRIVYERGYTLNLPDIPALDDTIVTVFMKTTDGRRSKSYNFTYVPVRTTATLGLPFSNGRILDSKLSDVYPNADISKGSIRRDTLLLGFEGDDTFYHTTRLKNGWKVTAINLVIKAEHYAGAAIIESGIGTESLYAKIHWSLIPSFPSFELDLLDYTLIYHLSGPVGQPYF
ncbi:hypothetical protein [Horticoccus sp. 23ND18S-11]|uniref:hypothetical protein n=1 Tax=Horticoccus sp. 23ND18S-11 TaxID=3391832 RepID=UPI0039C97945